MSPAREGGAGTAGVVVATGTDVVVDDVDAVVEVVGAPFVWPGPTTALDGDEFGAAVVVVVGTALDAVVTVTFVLARATARPAHEAAWPLEP